MEEQKNRRPSLKPSIRLSFANFNGNNPPVASVRLSHADNLRVSFQGPGSDDSPIEPNQSSERISTYSRHASIDGAVPSESRNISFVSHQRSLLDAASNDRPRLSSALLATSSSRDDKKRRVSVVPEKVIIKTAEEEDDSDDSDNSKGSGARIPDDQAPPEDEMPVAGDEVPDEEQMKFRNGSDYLYPKSKALSMASKPGSKLGSKISSLHSASDSQDDIGQHVFKVFRVFQNFLTDSATYRAIEIFFQSTRFRIRGLFLAQLILSIGTFLTVHFTLGSTLPNISWYNTLHAIFGSLGKTAFVLGWYMSNTVSKEYISRNLVKYKHGVPLNDVTVHASNLNAKQGRNIRYSVMTSLLAVEAAMWFLGVEMEWTMVPTSLGSYSCIVLSYSSLPITPTDIAARQTAQMPFAFIYNYGIPLDDGLIGGITIYPLDLPSRDFFCERNGMVYAVHAVCGDVTLHQDKDNLTGIHSEILKNTLWNSEINMELELTIPREWHNVRQWAHHTISQRCNFEIIFGDAIILSEYTSDEWGILSSQQASVITAGNVTLSRSMDPHSDFNTVKRNLRQALSDASAYSFMASWIQTAIVAGFNDTTIETPFSKHYNLFTWAFDLDDLYHAEYGYRGVTGAIGSLIFNQLMQYNSSETGDCEYFGMRGYGIIQANPVVVIIVYTALGVSLFFSIVQFCWWSLISGGSREADRAAKIFDSPLQLIYHMRDSVADLIIEYKGSDRRERGLRKSLEGINVKFGEDKRTRGEDTGSLILGPEGKVVKMQAKRQYL